MTKAARVHPRRPMRAAFLKALGVCAPGPFGGIAMTAGALSLLLSAGTAHAEQGTAALVGTVKDAATGKPVADAVVTVTSPSLQGDEVSVTDASGSYRIPNLPPGTYLLRLEKEAFKPYSRDEITLHADTTIRLNAQLLPEALKADEVAVVGRAPTVDVGSSSTGMVITSEFTSRVPLAPPGAKGSANQSIESVADVVPGARVDGYGVSFAGTTSPENSYLIDGLSVNNPAFGLIGTPLTMNFVKEVSIISGGFMPEYGRSTGGVLNAITKSGSNETHASTWVNYAPGGLAGTPHSVIRSGQTIETTSSLQSMSDIGGDVGGAIVKDKLWYYLGFDWSRTEYNVGRSLNETLLDASGTPISDGLGGSQTRPIPGTAVQNRAQADAVQTFAKLTWAVNKQNRIEISGNVNPYSSGGNGKFGINPTNGLPEVGNGSSVYVQQYAGTFGALAHTYQGSSDNALVKWSTLIDGQKTTLDTTVGWHHESGGRLPSDGSAIGSSSGLAGLTNTQWNRNTPALHSITDFETIPNPAVCANPASCPVTAYHTGGAEYIEEQTLNRYTARTVLTHSFEALGHHVAKAGLDLEFATYHHVRAYTGGHDLYEFPDGSAYQDSRQYGYLTGPDTPVVLNKLDNTTKSLTAGGFLQDSWAIADMVNLNVGLRYDTQSMYAADGTNALNLPNQWSPRVGVVYDPTHEGRAKIFGNYARYYESIPLDMMDREGTGEPSLISYHNSATCNPLVTSQLTNECQQNANRLPYGSAPNSLYAGGNNRAPVDPDIGAPSSDEIVLGGEYEIFRDARVGLSYKKRWLNRAIEDMTRDQGNTFFFGNPGEGIASDFPTAQRNYDAVTGYFTKLFSGEWLAQASYTISALRGNYSGLYRPANGQLDPNQNSDFDLKSTTVNAYGALPGDHTHSIKLFGAKDFIFGDNSITVGLGVRAESGAPTSYIGTNAIPGYPTYILQAGTAERLPWDASADFKLSYGVKLGKSNFLSATMDIFNLFNFQAPTLRDENYTSTSVSPVTGPGGLTALKNVDGTPFDTKTINPNFGRPIEYQAPRIFRFGLKATF